MLQSLLIASTAMIVRERWKGKTKNVDAQALMDHVPYNTFHFMLLTFSNQTNSSIVLPVLLHPYIACVH